MKKVAMIFLDAFSSNYLTSENTPFLSNLSKEGFYTGLKPMFAFQGIGAAIFSGTPPNTNKIWCDYVLKTDRNNSMPKFLKYLTLLCDILPTDNLNKYSRFALYKLFKQSYGIPNVIPTDLLDCFDLKLKKSYTDPKPLGDIVTLFDQLRDHNKRFYVSGLSGSLVDPTANEILKILKESYDLFLIKFGSLDKLGHKYGPESEKVHKKLREIDTILREVVESEVSEGVDFVFFSDHGMSPVFDTINLFDVLDKLQVKMVDDYILFLGSTVANFWFNNKRAREVITEALTGVDFGEVLTDVELKELKIDKIEATA